MPVSQDTLTTRYNYDSFSSCSFCTYSQTLTWTYTHLYWPLPQRNSQQRTNDKANDALLLKTHVFVNAAFACSWGVDNNANPDCVKSCTGYIIEITDCPVLWVSSIQMTIETSTMESEYTALSMALWSKILLLLGIESATKGLRFTKHKLLTFKRSVKEDNTGALILAKPEPGRRTPWSKFYALKLHWFWSWQRLTIWQSR